MHHLSAIEYSDQPTYLSEWYQTFNTSQYRMSTFFKSPLIYINLKHNNDWITYKNANIFKTNIKSHLLIDAQFRGAKDEWTPQNFPLYQITGLRISDRLKTKTQINYTE